MPGGFCGTGTPSTYFSYNVTTVAGGSILAQCTNILANPYGHRASLVAYCHNRLKRQNPGAIRTAPMIRDDGPTISLPG